jgi:Tol biopolymer transport system component
MNGQPPGLYFMDLQGNYISRINNPHLYGYGFPLTDWNNDLKLLVYTEMYKADVYRWKISVTNLDGSYYKNLTPEGNFDFIAYWGPDGKSILFERHNGGNSTEGWYNSKIMKVDFNTGKVSELFNPNMIENCFSVRFRCW